MAVVKPKKSYVRNSLVQTRLNNEEMREVLTKAQVYTRGNVSAFAREALLGFRPLKRVPKK